MKRIASKARKSEQPSQIPVHDPIPLVQLPLADMKESSCFVTCLMEENHRKESSQQQHEYYKTRLSHERNLGN